MTQIRIHADVPIRHRGLANYQLKPHFSEKTYLDKDFSMIIYFLLQFELQDPEASYDKHCERNPENKPSLEELLCLKTRSDSPKMRNFIKWFRRHIHTSTHTLGLKKIIQWKKQLRIGTLKTTPQGRFTNNPFFGQL